MTPGTTRPDIETGFWTLEKDHTTIGLVAKHLMVTRVRGQFENYEANVEIADDLTDSRIEVTIDAASITTAAEDRDNYLRSADFLDADNHPKLTFVSTDISSDGDKWKVTGDLTIRDVTRPITLDVTYEGTVADPHGNTRVGFSARAVLVREDWDLTWNSAIEGGGWLVSKNVSLEIEGQLIRA